MDLIPAERIERCIHLVRGQKVMLDVDLAAIYGVPAKRLNEQVKRNRGRFPQDFMFQLTGEEVAILRSQFATSRGGWGGRRYPPYVFTEHGAVMLASVLNSPTAVKASILVVRAFIKLRETLVAHKELAHKLADLERRLEHRLDKHDSAIKELFEAIRQLMEPPEEPPKERIGFHREPQARGRASGKLRR